MPEQNSVALSYLRWLANEDQTRQKKNRVYREYYDGEHDTQLTKRQRRFLQIKMGEEFRANYCTIVVDALVERLQVVGFDAGSQATQLWEWWQAARMDLTQGDVHMATVRDGDAYLLVGWDNEEGQPTFTYEPAYDGTAGVKTHYSGEHRGRAIMASKRWVMREPGNDGTGYQRRLNLYFPSRIEKYVSDQREFEGHWQRFHDDEGSWPLWWTMNGSEGGEPLGLPVIHFRNRAKGHDYGLSEIDNIIPMQNALNKTIIDLLGAADASAFRILYMIGDNPGSLEVGPGVIWYSEKSKSEVDLGAVPGEDLDKFIRVKDSFVMEIARISRTPLSYFQISGHRPAEGTLKQEEAGLVAKAKGRQVAFGNAWEDALAMARRLANAFGEGGMSEEQRLSTLWADPQTRNEREHIETIALKREKLRIPEERAWQEAGYSPQDIAEMQATEEYQQRVAQRGMLLQMAGGGEG